MKIINNLKKEAKDLINKIDALYKNKLFYALFFMVIGATIGSVLDEIFSLNWIFAITLGLINACLGWKLARN